MAANRLEPVYLIVGADDLKRETACKRLTHRFEDMGDITLNLDNISAERGDVDDIIGACNTLPFASEMRLVIVRDAERTSGDDAHALADYCANPCPTTVLCLVSGKLAKNSILYKAVTKGYPGCIVDCTPKSHRELPKLVSSMARTHGVTILPDAIDALIAQVGDSTVALDNELRKMSTAIGDAGVIDSALVASMVPRTAQLRPWDLSDALSARDTKRIVYVLSRLESQSPFGLLAICTTRVRDLICAKSLDGRGQIQGLSSVLGRPDWMVRDIPSWSRNFTSKELIDALIGAEKTEKLMKTGTDPDWALENWLLSVAER